MINSKLASSRVAHRVRYGVLLLVGVVLVTAVLMARKVEISKVRTEGNWLKQENHILAESVDSLEKLWSRAIEQAASIEINSDTKSRGKEAEKVVGVRQISYFSGKKVEHKVIEFPLIGEPPHKPSAEELKLYQSEQKMITSAGGYWINEPDQPVLYVLKQGTSKIVVLSLSIPQAHEIARAQLRETLLDYSSSVSSGGYREIRDIEGEILVMDGNEELSLNPADEEVRHYSIFGEWTFRYWFPREVVVSYDTSFLIGAGMLSTVILLGGYWLAREQENALKLAEDRVSFVNAVSHEFRTPLTNILLTADLVQDKVQNEQVKRRIGLICEESRRLARMVENVLNFSRLERGTLSAVDNASVDIRQLLEGCIQQFKPAFDRKNISCDLEISEHGEVNTDPDLLSQIILNLLSNIDKYAGKGALSKVKVEFQESSVVIYVCDNGPGIQNSDRVRVFEAFERVDERVSAGVTGAGLGLTICKSLAHQLGGDLVIEPPLTGKLDGAVFRLEISTNKQNNHS